MTKEVKLREALQRVQSEASAVRAFFHTWKALNIARGDTRLLATMNDYHHVDFFKTSMEGNFRLFFLSLGKIFEKSSKTLGHKRLAKTLRSNGHFDLAEEIEKVGFEHSSTIKKIRKVRNESIAHSGLASASEVLDCANITPDEIEALIDKLCGLLNTIGERMGFPGGISKGERNELAVQQLLETLHDNRFPSTDALSWDQVRQFFKEHGCVVVGHPEFRWYQESWEALGNAGLTSATEFEEFELAQTVIRLRAICLLAMYLGMYQAAGSFSELGGYFEDHPGVSWYLDSLDVQLEDIWDLAQTSGVIETDASSYCEDEETDEELLCEIAVDLASEENGVVFDALVEHYGGNEKLFASLWNSRVPPGDAEPFEAVVNSVQSLGAKLNVLGYVEGRMEGWWI